MTIFNSYVCLPEGTILKGWSSEDTLLKRKLQERRFYFKGLVVPKGPKIWHMWILHIYIYICVCVCVCTYVRIYIYVYNIYIYTHTVSLTLHHYKLYHSILCGCSDQNEVTLPKLGSALWVFPRPPHSGHGLSTALLSGQHPVLCHDSVNDVSMFTTSSMRHSDTLGLFQNAFRTASA